MTCLRGIATLFVANLSLSALPSLTPAVLPVSTRYLSLVCMADLGAHSLTALSARPPRDPLVLFLLLLLFSRSFSRSIVFNFGCFPFVLSLFQLSL